MRTQLTAAAFSAFCCVYVVQQKLLLYRESSILEVIHYTISLLRHHTQHFQMPNHSQSNSPSADNHMYAFAAHSWLSAPSASSMSAAFPCCNQPRVKPVAVTPRLSAAGSEQGKAMSQRSSTAYLVGFGGWFFFPTSHQSRKFPIQTPSLSPGAACVSTRTRCFMLNYKALSCTFDWHPSRNVSGGHPAHLPISAVRGAALFALL